MDGLMAFGWSQGGPKTFGSLRALVQTENFEVVHFCWERYQLHSCFQNTNKFKISRIILIFKENVIDISYHFRMEG